MGCVDISALAVGLHQQGGLGEWDAHVDDRLSRCSREASRCVLPRNACGQLGLLYLAGSETADS